MILYSPLDGEAIVTKIKASPKSCFLMTMLGDNAPPEIDTMRDNINAVCKSVGFQVLDATDEVTGRDFLLKIWKMIFAAPLSIGIIHQDMPEATKLNIFYEIGIAQAMGKETVIVKSAGMAIPSDLVRTEYIEHNKHFKDKLLQYMKTVISLSDYYQTVADQLDRNPVLSIDYLRRAYLISEDPDIKNKIHALAESLGDRSSNSVEHLAAVTI